MILGLLRTIFIRNWGLKLFSFILALFLWFTLIPEEKTFSEKILTVPLEVHNIPPGMELVEKPPSTVDIRIRASNRLINDITPTNVHAVLNLQKTSIEKEDYSLESSMISIPAGAEVQSINPSQVKLRLEKLRRIEMEIEPNIVGELAEGLVLRRVEVIPPKILVQGPESKIHDTDKVRTGPIDISLLTQSVEIQTDLILPNPDVVLVSSVARATVRLVIQEIQPEENK